MKARVYNRLIYLTFISFLIVSCDGGPAYVYTPTPAALPGDTVATETVYALPTGGSISIPIDALPTGTEVSIIETVPPALPDGVVAVGTGYFVDMHADLSLPATIRLPIPEGENADELAIIRIEVSGPVSILQTTVEDDLLVARTPGFSWVTPGRLAQSLRDTEPIIKGPDYLTVSTTPEIKKAQYFESVFADAPDLTRSWRAWSHNIEDNKFTLETADDSMKSNVVTLHCLEEGRIHLQLTMIEPTTGVRRLAEKTIEVRSRDDIEVSAELDINIIAPLIVEKNESFNVGANILNLGNDTVSTWNWSLAGTEGSCHEDCSSLLVTPAFSFSEAGTRTFTVSATAGERLGQASLNIKVMGELTVVSFETMPEDGQIQSWTSSRPSVVTAKARVIYGRDPYTFRWKLRPEGIMDPMENVHHDTDTDNIEISFDQPGEYPLSLQVNDAAGQFAPTLGHFHRWIFVGPPENVQVALLGVPAEWEANRQLAISLEARGGQLIKRGLKKPYFVIVSWGDDNIETFILKADSPNAWNRLDDLSHAYQETKSYTISVDVFPLWLIGEIPIELIVAGNVFFPGGTKGQASAEIQIVEADTSFGFPKLEMCPEEVYAMTCPMDWCERGEEFWSTFRRSDLYDLGWMGLYEAECNYEAVNPHEEAVWRFAGLELFYAPGFPNSNGCGKASEDGYIVRDGGKGGVTVYSTERQLLARPDGIFKIPEVSAKLGELVVKAANAGVGEACKPEG